MKKTLESLVRGHEGPCKPTWLQKNSIYLRVDTRQTGMFKNVRKHWLFGWVRYGKEFHGYIGSDGKVRTTEGIYSTSQFI